MLNDLFICGIFVAIAFFVYKHLYASEALENPLQKENSL